MGAVVPPAEFRLPSPVRTRIAVVLPNWIGDVVMATPTLRALREHFGDRASLLGVMRPYVAEVLDGLDWLEERLLYDPRGRQRSQGTLGLVRELRRKKPDNIVLLTNSLRTGLIARFSGARRRIGYNRSGRGLLLTDCLDPPRDGWRFRPVSPVDCYLRLAAVLGCAATDRRLQLATTNRDEQAAQDVWQRMSLSGASRVVALNPGGAYGAAKHWPVASFVDLAKRLASEPQTGVLVLCGPSEREAAGQIERSAAHPRVISLASAEPSIGLSKACVRRSQLLITTDSGPRHFAAAFGVPCLTLFGPTDPRWSWNYHPGETVLQENLPCVPCARRVCPLGHHRCMTDLTADKVYAAARRVLEVRENS